MAEISPKALATNLQFFAHARGPGPIQQHLQNTFLLKNMSLYKEFSGDDDPVDSRICCETVGLCVPISPVPFAAKVTDTCMASARQPAMSSALEQARPEVAFECCLLHMSQTIMAIIMVNHSVAEKVSNARSL